MARLPVVDPAVAHGRARDALDAAEAELGFNPTMTKTMACAPALLEGWLGLYSALSRGSLDAAMRERIALGVAQANGCAYCLCAHSYLGARHAHLSDKDVHDSRMLRSTDRRVDAILQFVDHVVSQRGDVDEGDVERLRGVGCSDEEIAEVIGNIALNVLTNYFNKIALPEIDFPRVEL